LETLAPDGTNTAEKFTLSGVVYGSMSGSIASTAANTGYSIYAKAGTATTLSMQGGGGTFWAATLSGAGAITYTSHYSSGSITLVGDGWYRISVTTGTTAFNPFGIINTAVAGQTFYLWGLQQEVNSAAVRPFGGGNDTLDGGAGTGDVLDYSRAMTDITLSVASISTATPFSYTVMNGFKTDQLSNFEGIISGSGADSLTGDGQANVLTGNAGNDTLLGGDGNDTLSGGTGSDSLDGGLGTGDVLDYSYATTNITLAVGATSLTVVTGTDVDTLANFEGIIGGSGADSLTGDANANYLGGNAGNDTLLGGDGNDTLSGGVGADSLDGGTGTGDVLDYSYVTGNLVLSVATATSGTYSVAGSTTDVDTLKNFEGIIGGSGNDSFTGNASANYLAGNAGNDTLTGNTGDTLVGGDGNDSMIIDSTFLGSGSINGGIGTDTVSFAANSGDMTLSTANFSNIITQVEVLDFTALNTNVTAAFSATDIANLTGQAEGATNNLEIFQNTGDTVTFSGVYTSSTVGSDTTHTFYTDDTFTTQLAQVLVHNN
jgi:Ca2+-binding RTX toxin-like protein